MGQKKSDPAVTKFLDGHPKEQQRVLAAVRDLILRHLPEGYVERLAGTLINYEVPLERCSKTYNGQPLVYAALAARKRYFALYLVAAYQDARVAKRLADGFRASGKKLDMGKSCLRFRGLDDLPLELIGDVIGGCPLAEFVAKHQAGRAKA